MNVRLDVGNNQGRSGRVVGGVVYEYEYGRRRCALLHSYLVYRVIYLVNRISYLWSRTSWQSCAFPIKRLLIVFVALASSYLFRISAGNAKGNI